MTTNSDERRATIEAYATKAFGFLEQSTGATAEKEIGSDRSLIAYVLPELFVEIELDWQERATFVLVGQPVGGGRPDGYYVDSRGRKVRWHLGAALEEGGHTARASALKRLVKKSGSDAMLEQIDAYSTELRELLPRLGELIRHLRSA